MPYSNHTYLNRRNFLGLTTIAFSGLALSGCATFHTPRRVARGYGPLQADPAGLLDLPKGFSYQIISRLGDGMDDGLRVPDHADGMGAFPLDADRVILVRNHELEPRHIAVGPFRSPNASGRGFDRGRDGGWLPGGTTTLIYNQRTARVEHQYLSLAGTIRNCAGGTTPWGSWLSCEEDVSPAGNGLKEDHGWVFEVPAAHRGRAEAKPLREMGRFNHEAAAVDPRTGIVYLTEDRPDGLLYRYLPNRRGQLIAGGRLQALGFKNSGFTPDSRNWTEQDLAVGQWFPTRWIDLEGPDSANDDLRLRGHAGGGVMFARGEGVHFGDGGIYFCCTSGGPARLGQIMCYRPSPHEGQPNELHVPGSLQIFVESNDAAMFNFGDNLTVAPTGDLFVCEDQYTDIVDNHVRGVTPRGEVYSFARLKAQTELAGVCFSPDGHSMFLNLYSPAMTLCINGPWLK